MNVPLALALFVSQAPALGGLLHLLIVIVVLGLIFLVIWWAISYLPLPAPFAQIARFVVVLIFAIVLIYLLFPLAGLH